MGKQASNQINQKIYDITDGLCESTKVNEIHRPIQRKNELFRANYVLMWIRSAARARPAGAASSRRVGAAETDRRCRSSNDVCLLFFAIRK